MAAANNCFRQPRPCNRVCIVSTSRPPPTIKRNQVDGLYPYVEIVFTVSDGEQHYHIPLLLTANGYTTYRGS